MAAGARHWQPHVGRAAKVPHHCWRLRQAITHAVTAVSKQHDAGALGAVIGHSQRAHAREGTKKWPNRNVEALNRPYRRRSKSTRARAAFITAAWTCAACALGPCCDGGDVAGASCLQRRGRRAKSFNRSS
jgi:hypothetical protein